MTRISSHSTFFHKRVFPTFWFGFLGVFVCTVILPAIFKHDWAEVVPSIFASLFLGIVGYVVMKMFIFHLVDEVYDCGDSILVKNKGREARFALSDFRTVGYTGLINPPTIVLALREPSGDFGNEITFVPPFRWWSYSMHPVAHDLMRRVYETRQGESSLSSLVSQDSPRG